MGKYQRDHTDTEGKKHRGQDIEKKKCPRCGHGRMWVARGALNPQYGFKCTRCQHRI